MAWTHTYDLLIKLLLMVVIILFCIPVPDLLEAEGITLSGGNLGAVMILTIILLFACAYHFLLRTLSSYLYARFTLKMPISYAEAKPLNKAFTTLVPMGKWLPMRELLLYPPEDRYRQALTTVYGYEAMEAELDRMIREKSGRPPFSKTAFEIVAVSVAILCAIIGMANFPPASYLSRMQGSLLGDGRYYPLVNILILCIPPFLILYRIEKRMKERW